MARCDFRIADVDASPSRTARAPTKGRSENLSTLAPSAISAENRLPFLSDLFAARDGLLSLSLWPDQQCGGSRLQRTGYPCVQMYVGKRFAARIADGPNSFEMDAALRLNAMQCHHLPLELT